MALAVLIDGHQAAAHAAADPAVQEILAFVLALDPASVGGGEDLRRDQRLMVAREPLPVELDLTEVDA